MNPEKPGKIFQAMSAVMKDIGAIAKTNRNQIQKYNFRGIDDVYNTVHPLLVAHEIFVLPEVLEQQREERETKSGGALFYTRLKVRYRFVHADGSSVEAVVCGEGMDSSDKSTNKALSAALKYAFFQIFCIPTEDPDKLKDSETENHEPKPTLKKQGEISKEQLKRLHAIKNAHGWSDEEAKKLIQSFGYESSKDLSWRDYEKICQKLELGPKTKQQEQQ